MRLRPKIRLDVLSGFLGSGKTTLLRGHLAAVDARGVALVINEFGTTPIDHRLVRAGDDALHVLADGCACCAVADRLRATLLALLAEDARGDVAPIARIVLETSGLADPASILSTLRADEVLAEYLERGACVVAFDAIDGIGCAGRYPEVRSQLAAADAIVVTKGDLASPGGVEAARRYAAAVNPLAAITVAGTSTLALDRLFDVAPRVPVAGVSDAAAPALHAQGVGSFCLAVDGPLDWASFSVWLTCLLHRHGARILRFKAVVDTGTDAWPLVIQGVRHVVHPPQHLPDDARSAARVRGRSDLVFIVDGLPREAIEDSLQRFLRFSSATLARVPASVA